MNRPSFTVEARSLASALRKLLPLIQRRNTIPILSTARFRRRSADTLELMGADLDLQVSVTCAAEIAGKVAVCSDPRPLATLLDLIGTERVRFEVVGADLHLTWAGGKARFPTLPFDDFPTMSATGPQTTGSLDAAFATDVLMRVLPAVSREETRYYLNGVCLDGTKGEALAVTTDGHRLLTVDAGEGARAALGGASIIVPRGFVERWVALGRGDEAEITVHGGAKLQVVTAEVELLGKLIAGAFPDWRRVLPKDTARVWEAPRPALQMALRKLAAICVEKSPTLTIMPAEALRMQVRSFGGCGGALEIDVEGGLAELQEPRGFNIRYLQQAVDACRGATIRLMQPDASSPAEVVGSDDASTTHVVVMPLRVTGTDAFAESKPETLKRVA